MLPDQVGFNEVVGLETQRGASRPEVATINRTVGDGVVRVAVALGPGPRETQSHGVFHQRQVDHLLDAVTVVVAHVHRQPRFGMELGLGSDQIDHASGGVSPIQSALRPAQHFHTIEIVELLLEEAIADERGVVEGHGHCRIGSRGDGLGPDAANLDRISGKIGLGERHVGDLGNQVRTTGNLALGEVLHGECGNRDRHILKPLFALLTRHDDFFDSRTTGLLDGTCGRPLSERVRAVSQPIRGPHRHGARRIAGHHQIGFLQQHVQHCRDRGFAADPFRLEALHVGIAIDQLDAALGKQCIKGIGQLPGWNVEGLHLLGGRCHTSGFCGHQRYEQHQAETPQCGFQNGGTHHV